MAATNDTVTGAVTSPQGTEPPLALIPTQPQRQDSLTDQRNDLIWVARRLGIYDAADLVSDALSNRGGT